MTIFLKVGAVKIIAIPPTAYEFHQIKVNVCTRKAATLKIFVEILKQTVIKQTVFSTKAIKLLSVAVALVVVHI